MKFNYSPTQIEIFRDFPLAADEISLSFANEGGKPIFINKRAIIRDNNLVPVAEGRLEWLEADNRLSVCKLAPGGNLLASLLIDAENLALLKGNQEYNAIIQYSESGNFAWTDKMLEGIPIFRDWDENRDIGILDEIARMLPVQFEMAPLHTRNLLAKTNHTLCLDFGTSFSACALAVSPARARELACYKNTEKPQGIYFTRFMEGNEARNIAPSALALKRIIDESHAEWLCGYDAVEWARKNPEKGSFITDVKGLLLNLEETRRLADQHNVKREFTHEEIVTAYLNYLVEKSKRYFGVNFDKIHITTPVSYPERQRKAYEHVLGKIGFKDIKSRLDEARAPLYYFLSRTVEKAWNQEKGEGGRDTGYKALSYLIIDCGGGSTDAILLRGIKLKSSGGEMGRGIKWEMQEPQKGGFDFGGTDLTELLFHYLKMRIIQAAQPDLLKEIHPALGKVKDFLIDSLIETQDQNIFWELYLREKEILEKNGDRDKIPEEQHKFAYGLFNEAAEALEKVFPSDEKLNMERDNASWEKIHLNRNTLWQLAEALKIAIFANDTPRKLNLLDLREAPEAVFWLEGKDGQMRQIKAGNLKKHLDFDSYELRKLFRPIIFKEISRIRRQLNIQTDLSDKEAFFNVRFVGQSTNIPLFKEALAYFVPGAMIEEENKLYQAKNQSRFQPIPAEEKKICCVKGTAQFLSHVSAGYLKDDKFVARTRVLKNFCRFGPNGNPVQAGVYNFEENPKPCLIARNELLENARGAIIRDLAEEMEELFGTTFDEEEKLEGYINLRKDEISHALSEEEEKEISERWKTLLGKLKSEDGGSPVLIEASLLEDGASQRYEFRPYYWDSAKKSYMTTPEPKTMCFFGE